MCGSGPCPDAFQEQKRSDKVRTHAEQKRSDKVRTHAEQKRSDKVRTHAEQKRSDKVRTHAEQKRSDKVRTHADEVRAQAEHAMPGLTLSAALQTNSRSAVAPATTTAGCFTTALPSAETFSARL